jgi:hypothetical protein
MDYSVRESKNGATSGRISRFSADEQIDDAREE